MKLAHYTMDEVKEKLKNQTIADFRIGNTVAYIPDHVSRHTSDDIEFGEVQSVNSRQGTLSVVYMKDALMTGMDATAKQTRPENLVVIF